MHSKIFMYFLILNLLMIKTSLANQAGLPQLNFETYPSLIFWSVLSLITLYLLMSRLVTPKVSEVLNFREQNIQNNLLKAKSLKEEADIIIDKIKIEQDTARSEARNLIEKSIAINKELLEKQSQEISEKINKKINDAVKEIDKEKIKKVSELLDNSSSVAEKIINKVADLQVDKKELNKLVKEAESLITKDKKYGT
jgi:F-type H+-transporting ATPase subunit b